MAKIIWEVEDLDEICDIIEEHLGIRPSRGDVYNILKVDDGLSWDIGHWGPSDTPTREALVDATIKFLTGKDVPVPPLDEEMSRLVTELSQEARDVAGKKPGWTIRKG